MFRTVLLAIIASVVTALALPVQAQEKSPDDLVLASGNHFKITVGDFREYIKRLGPLARHRHLGADTIRSIIDNMTNTSVFAQHAKAVELEGSDEIERKLREHAVRQLLAATKSETQEIRDKEIKKYFHEHPERYLQGELRRASVILVKDKSKAEELRKKATKADSRAFAQLARENSINLQTRMRGGDLRYFNRDGIPLQLLSQYADDPSQAPKTSNIDAVLVEAAFQLDTIGTLSPVVKVGDNFAIVRLSGKRDPQFKTWQDAKEEIRVRLTQQRSREGSERLVARLRKEQAVKVTPKPLENFIFKEQPRGAAKPQATKKKATK